MTPLFDAYSKKQLIAGILRSALVAIYMLLTAALIWLCRDFTLAFIADRIIPYGLPPLLSLICAGFLSLFVLNLEQIRTETFLFSVICLAFAGLNLDIFLLSFIPDPTTALLISRMDHFILALVLIGANLHLTFLVCEKQTHWWLVYLAYGIGAVMALFTPTDLYFRGVHRYFWGFFAQKAVLYDVMSLIWLTGTLYAIFLLSFAYRSTKNPHKKDTIKFILLGFVSSGVLSLTNTPAMYGIEVYPLGTFTFIPLLLLAWGLFKHNLRIAIQEARVLIFTLGRLALTTMIGLLPAMLMPWETLNFKLIAGVVLIVFFHAPVSRLWDAFLNLLIKRSSDLLQKEVYALTGRLSETHYLIDIHHKLCRWLFRVLMNSQSALVFREPGHEGFSGWRTVNPESFSGFFSHSPGSPAGDIPIRIAPDHPILKKITATRPKRIPHNIIARWMDEGQLTLDPNDCLLQAGLVLTIFSKNRLNGLVLIGHHLNDRSYTETEKENLETIGAVLGPVIENAQLLESLEEKIQARTRDLNTALESLKEKNRRISQNHGVIKKQNHIFLSLFETSTRIHEIEDLHELFADTLNQLRSLFPHLGFGILHEGERSEIIESGAFIGISEKEQTVIIENRLHLTDHNISQMMNEKLTVQQTEGKIPAIRWMVQSIVIGGSRPIGKIIIKGPGLDQISQRVVSIFLAQVSAAAHNLLLMKKLETMAHTDALTGVANRSFFDREMKNSLKNAALFPNIFFSIVMMDINGLKRVNDHFGHDKGDEMIKRVADTLAAAVRKTDTLARMGGDEFVVLLPATNSSQARMLVDRIRDKERTLFLDCRRKSDGNRAMPIRFSIGMAGSDETSPENVMKLADQRMYVDKEHFYQTTIKTLYADHS